MAQSVKQSHLQQSGAETQFKGSDYLSEAERSSSFIAPSRAESLNEIGDDQLISFHEVTRALSREKSLSGILHIVAEKAQQLTRSSSTALCLLDDAREHLNFVAVAGRGASEMAGQKIRVEDALPGHTALTGEQLLAYNPTFADAYPASSKSSRSKPAKSQDDFVPSGGIRSAAIVPIYGEAAPIGSLGAIDRIDGESFTGKDLLVLHVLASLSSAAIQQEKSQRERKIAQRERDVLQEAAQTTASTLNVQRILDGLLATADRSVDMFAGMVFLLNDERTHLFIASDRGLTDFEKEIQILADGKLATAAFSGGAPFMISSPEIDPRFEPFFPIDRPQPLSWMVAPLISRDRQLGLVVIASLARDAYTQEDLRLLSSIAAPAAVAMENAELYEQATRRSDEATAIYELSQALHTKHSLSEMLGFVAENVLALLRVDKFALFLHNPKLDCLEIMVARNIRRQTVQQMKPTRENGGIAWWVYEYETPAAVLNVSTDHRNRSYPIEQENIASLVSVPLQAGNNIIGVIHAMSSTRRSFTVAEMELLYTIANQVGVAIANFQIIDEIRKKSEELRRSAKRVARALGSAGDLSQTAQHIVDLAAELMSADKCVLYTKSDEELVFRAAHGFKAVDQCPLKCVSESGDLELLPCLVQRRNRAIVLDDISKESKFAAPSFIASLGKSASYLGLPLKVGSGLVGVLEVYSKERRSFKTDELRQYSAFAAQAAMAVQNAMLVEKAGRRERELHFFVGLAGLSTENDPLEKLKKAVALSALALSAESACFAALDDLDHVQSWGVENEQYVADFKSLVARYAASYDSPLRIPLSDSEKDSQPSNLLNGRSGMLAIAGGYALLLLRPEWRDPFDDIDLKIGEAAVSSIAGLMALAKSVGR
jgi:GAF domain-containing protein